MMHGYALGVGKHLHCASNQSSEMLEKV